MVKLLTGFLMLFFSVSLHAQSKAFDMKIYQHGKEQLANNKQFFLQKDTFVIQLEMYATNKVFLNALASPLLYNLPNDSLLDLMQHVPAMSYAEYPNNQKQQLYIDKRGLIGFHSMSITNDSVWRRLERVKVLETKRIGWRTVSSFMLMYKSDKRETVAVSDFDEPLYFMLLAIDFSAVPATQIQRELYHIVWQE